MLIAKIKEVFIPGYISPDGRFYDSMEANYTGFKIEIVEHYILGYGVDFHLREDSKLIGLEHIVIEKDTLETVALHKGDMVSVSARVITDGLNGFKWDDWVASTRVIVNTSDRPFLKKVEKE